MNEGWASFWHYKLMNEVGLPGSMHIPFIKSHNQVIRPHIGGINPYHLGFWLFKKIEKESGLDECFFVRENFNDESFLRTFLDYDSMLELNLFTYSKKKEAYTIDEISSTDGWKEVKEDLIKSVGMNGMPRMFVSELEKTGELLIEHEHDGRDLELNHAEAVVNHMTNIWGDMVKLKTIIEEELWEI